MARRTRRATKSPRKAPPNRRQLARREVETVQLRRLWFALAAAGVVVIAVLVYGAYQEYVAKPNAPVAMVNGVPIQLRAYQHRVRYEQLQLAMRAAELQDWQAQLDPEAEGQEFMVEYVSQQLQQIQTMVPQVPYEAVDTMIDDELVRQEAEQRGIAVGDEELQENVEEQFGYYRTPPTPFPTPTPVTETLSIATPVPTPTPMTLEEYEKAYKTFVDGLTERTGMSEAELRGIFRNALLRQKLQEALAAEVPTEADQVHARHILVETEEEAQQLLERLNGGEAFDALAAENSIDDSNKDDGGDLGWFPQGQMVPAFEEAAFGAEVDELVGPVETSFGWHIIRIEGHEVRALDPAALQARQGQALQEWLSEARLGEGIENLWKPEMAPTTAAS
jgi:hypothetical protein